MVKGPESQCWRSSSGVSGARGQVSSPTRGDLCKEFVESITEISAMEVSAIKDFMERDKLESWSPFDNSPKEASDTEQSTVVTADGSGDQVQFTVESPPGLINFLSDHA